MLPSLHRLLHRFNHNLAVCDQTLRNFAAQAKTDIARRFDVVAIRSEMKRSSLTPSSSSNEVQNARDRAHDLSKWNEFKLAGFSRTLTALYSVTLLHALIKVQLSIVSRYVLSEQVPSNSSQPQRSPLGPVPTLGSSLTEEVNRSYFALSEWGQREGLSHIADLVSQAVTGEMSRWELNANSSVEDIQMMIAHIRQRVDEGVAAQVPPAGGDEGALSSLPSSASPFLPFIYPPTSVIEQKLESMEPQLREAAKAALAASSAAPSLSSSPPPPLPTSSPSALTNLARTRLHEMAAETLSVLHSETFALAVQSSLSSTFDLLLSSLLSSLPSSGTAMPFASVMVKMMKLFDSLLPDQGGGLYDVLTDNVQVREMCEVIYFPIDEQGRRALHVPQVVGGGEMRSLQALLTAPAVQGRIEGSLGGRGSARVEELPATPTAVRGANEAGRGLPISGVSGEEGKFERG